MKKITLIFTAFAFVAGVAVISCTKELATPQAITASTDVVLADNSVSDINATIDDYEAANATAFVDPTLKAMVVDPTTVTMHPKRIDSCATVTMTKTTVVAASAITGATITFKIDFGTTGCVGKDGKARRGTITSTYSWVKLGGWTRVSTIDMYISDVHHVGINYSTYGIIGVNKHAYITDSTVLTITAKDGSWKKWNSLRQRELLEGNGGVNPLKEWRINGNSSFSNSAGGTSSYTISTADPLIKWSDCKTFTSGTVTLVAKTGITTTVNYLVAGQHCPDGFTVTTPPDKNGKGGVMRFIKFGK